MFSLHFLLSVIHLDGKGPVFSFESTETILCMRQFSNPRQFLAGLCEARVSVAGAGVSCECTEGKLGGTGRNSLGELK